MRPSLITLSLLAVALVGISVSPPAQSQSAVPPREQTLGFGIEDAVNIVLHDGNNSYIVPDGKVLVLEHIVWALESSSTHQTVTIKPAGVPAGVGSFQLKFSTTQPDMHTFERPLRIVGDGAAGVSILNNSQVDWRDCALIGFLRDV